MKEPGSVASVNSLAGMEREREEWAWRERKQVLGVVT